MNIIKLTLGAIGLVFVGMLLLWVLGWLGSLLSLVFWVGIIGLVGYGGYRLFRKLEDKALGAGNSAGIGNRHGYKYVVGRIRQEVSA